MKHPWTHYNKPYLGVPINGTHPLAKGLVGCWVMNENSGNVVQDLSGNVRTGTITGAVWVAGEYGHAVYCDGCYFEA